MTLVGTVYARPLGVLLAAVAGMASSQAAAHATGDRALWLLAQALTTIGLLRSVLVWVLPRHAGHRPVLLAVSWDVGAFAFALLTGLLAFYSVYFRLDPAVTMLLVCNAVAYATGIAARNAGRPRMAIVQLVLAQLPCSIALLLRDDLVHRTLGAATLPLIPAMVRITLEMFRVLRDSVASAETSARLAENMQKIAQTDAVTGLLNRSGLSFHLSSAIRATAGSRKLALFWFDLDRFKEVNDTLGHATGDRVLAEMAQRLRAKAPEGAIVARFGGDEFIVACDASSRAEIEDLAEALHADLSRPVRLDSMRLEVGASMGVATYPDDARDGEALMQGADLALYDAKSNGRSRLSYFTPAMTRELLRRREIEAELRLALQREELSVYFQPVVDLATGKIRSFEALVRWFHPEKGELRPEEFIPVAEESGAIITLGNWITARAARVAAQWPADVTLAVNLSPVQIRAPGAAMAILGALRDAQLPPDRLELEITETVLLDEGPQTEDFIARLTEAGVRFALDDFGTGYSSLSSLSKYHFGKIKVDRSFVSGPQAGAKSAAIIRATSEMAATLDMEIVAEGLETIDQVRAVSAAGCTLGQGYYFSRPVPDYVAGLLLAEERGAPPLVAVG